MRVYVGHKNSLCAKPMTSSDVTKIVHSENALHPICLLQLEKKLALVTGNCIRGQKFGIEGECELLHL